jgi:hypothetical protein
MTSQRITRFYAAVFRAQARVNRFVVGAVYRDSLIDAPIIPFSLPQFAQRQGLSRQAAPTKW